MPAERHAQLDRTRRRERGRRDHHHHHQSVEDLHGHILQMQTPTSVPVTWSAGFNPTQERPLAHAELARLQYG